MTHVFDEAIAVDARPDGVFRDYPPAYGNGMGPGRSAASPPRNH